MKIRDLIKQLEDMLLIYGDRTILTITDIESEYSIKEIDGKMCAKYFEPSDHVAEVTVIIKRNSSIKMLPSVTPEPEPCEDAVSRKELLKFFSNNGERSWTYDTVAIGYIKALPSVTPERKTGKWIVHYECPKCGEITKDFTEYCPFCGAKMEVNRMDLIERQEALDILDGYQVAVENGKSGAYEKYRKQLCDLPNTQSERKTGKWIHEIVNSYTEKTYCSECGKSAPFVYVSDDYYGVHAHGEVRKTDFCPHCGADMRGEQDEPDKQTD